MGNTSHPPLPLLGPEGPRPKEGLRPAPPRPRPLEASGLEWVQMPRALKRQGHLPTWRWHSPKARSWGGGLLTVLAPAPQAVPRRRWGRCRLVLKRPPTPLAAGGGSGYPSSKTPLSAVPRRRGWGTERGCCGTPSVPPTPLVASHPTPGLPSRPPRPGPQPGGPWACAAPN